MDYSVAKWGSLVLGCLAIAACSTNEPTRSVLLQDASGTPIQYCVSVQGNGLEEQLAWSLRKRMQTKGMIVSWATEEKASCRIVVQFTYRLNSSKTAFQKAALRYHDAKTAETQRVSVEHRQRTSAFFTQMHKSPTQRLYDLIDRLFPDQYTPRFIPRID